MSAYAKLLRLSLLNHWAGFRRGSWRKSDGKLDISRIVSMIVITAGIGVMAWMVIQLEIMFFGALTTFGQPMLLPALSLFVAMVSTLILGLFPTLSALYLGRDAPWMAALPVSSTAVMAAKWTEVYFGDMLINLGLVGPAALLYGLHLHADALYYVRAVAIILASPLLPLVITTLLVTLLTRVTGLARHRELCMMIASILLVALVWGIEFTLLPRIEDQGEMYLVQMLLRRNGLVSLLVSSVPPVQWALDGLMGDWLRLAMFLGLSVAAASACLLLVGRGYLSLCLNQGEHAARRRAVRMKERDWQVRGHLRALYLREWNELVKSPTYAMNTFSGAIIFPVMLLAMYLAGSAGSGETVRMLFDELNGLIDGLSRPDITLIFAACLAFPTFVNIAASTAISREGGRLPISRMIPVPARTQMRAKLLVALTVNCISMSIALIVLAVVFPRLILWLIPAVLMATAASYATTAVALTVDAIQPRLNWINETQAMKQNFNAMISMLLSLLLLAALIAIPFLLLGATATARMLAVLGALLAECLLGFLLMRLVAEKRYAALEG